MRRKIDSLERVVRRLEQERNLGTVYDRTYYHALLSNQEACELACDLIKQVTMQGYDEQVVSATIARIEQLVGPRKQGGTM